MAHVMRGSVEGWGFMGEGCCGPGATSGCDISYARLRAAFGVRLAGTRVWAPGIFRHSRSGCFVYPQWST
jgi:hypothetical protein